MTALIQTLQHALSAHAPRRLTLDGFAESAVLVPILERPARLLFTVRRADLPKHAGQISFPGGRRDVGDRALADTALRELEEELGVPARAVELIGQLDDVPTPTGFVISPFVGRVSGEVALRPSEREVADVFTADLEALAGGGLYRSGGVTTFHGVSYELHEYHVEQRRVWGATARIVHQLLALGGSAP
jgi:8-oxo-dGTP pyrophosphatase MutT (NUDIX family)